MDEELDYISSSPLLSTPIKTVPQDEADLSTLKRLQKLQQDEIDSYSTIDRLTTDDKTFSVAQQLAINKAVQAHLISHKSMVDKTITDIAEKYNG